LLKDVFGLRLDPHDRVRDSRSMKDPVAGFYDDVYDHPDDDAPRHVLADRLQEHGDPHGELIALQLKRSGRAPTDEERARELKLIAKHQAVWLGELHPFVLSRSTKQLDVGPLRDDWPPLWNGRVGQRSTDLRARWDRGFLDGCDVRLTSAVEARESRRWSTLSELGGAGINWILDQMAVLYGNLGGIRALYGMCEGPLARLCDTKAGARVERVSLQDHGEPVFQSLAKLPRLRRVLVINKHLSAGPDTIARIVAAPVCARLEELAFHEPTFQLSLRPAPDDKLIARVAVAEGRAAADALETLAPSLPHARFARVEVIGDDLLEQVHSRILRAVGG
jgi:uncharacterized protein (TIGR02996 family)